MDLSKELESIRNELQMIKSFLKDAENKAHQNELVRAWVRQVRDVGYRIEDAIDEHDLLACSKAYNQPWSHCLGFFSICFNKLMLSHDDILASTIASIKDELVKIQQRKSSYNLHAIDQEDSGRNDPRVDFLYHSDFNLVGFEDAQNALMELLHNDSYLIISIVGMGGIGKTTIAWNIYENVEVKRHFHVRAWVSVTQFYSTKGILMSMLQGFYKSAMESLPAHIDILDEMSLVAELRKFLENKRYMIIFDDVWERDLWNHVKNAFPNHSNGSKILLTTRLESVSLAWKGSWNNNCLYKLKLLPPNKAIELFLKRAFPAGEYPKWCEEISHSIIDKCGGLPLAIVTVGSLLSTKNTDLSEWKKFCDNFSSEFEQNQQLFNVSKILMLSYNNLPDYLKPCLVYLSMFPEGLSIECNRLIKLWIAEGFIKKKGVQVEDVAKEYLLELIQRSLVHVSTRYDCGRLRTVRVHDLLHEILRRKSSDINFGQVLVKEKNHIDVGDRRLSIQEKIFEDVAKIICSNTNRYTTRSLLVFNAKGEMQDLLIRPLLKNTYLLKVLDLQGAPIKAIPNEVGNLYLLRYLSLRSTKVTSIPRTIGSLVNLLTLDLKRCPVTELPVEVGNLQKLRHLIVYQNTWNNTLKFWEIRAVKLPKGALLGCLESLQKLADVNVATSTGFLTLLSDYKTLKYLAISNIKRENSWALCKAIEHLDNLESLNITVDYESDDPIELQHITSPPLTLQRVYLVGPLDRFPDWIKNLDNLKKLRFRGSKLKDIRMEILQDLPNLTMLGINKDVYYGERLVFRVGGFKKLKAMYYNYLIHLNSVEVQNGALPALEYLNISRCSRLKEVPIGLQYLKKLTSLRVVEMPEEFVTSLNSLPHITNHIPDIKVGFQIPSGHHVLKKL